MYQDFFGLSEQAFSIAPDPHFLFLGPRHQEALLHLRHGLLGSGGFLLLTGEVGTGKTTLSRAVVSELADVLNVVFIVNPKLSERELLASIAAGFGLTQVSETDSLKTLTDALSSYLMAAGESQRHPVVLIDEAQHLLPSVLEQLRLLTNLENDAKKLLSVVLIGQPELHELLQRHELRQVAQRIVARYQLLPLTQKEMNAYINHRLELAQGHAELFNSKARRLIWVATGGTPRLINLLCDRALQLAAYREQKVVTADIVKAAFSALPHKPRTTGVLFGFWTTGRWGSGLRVGTLCLTSLAVAFFAWWLWSSAQGKSVFRVLSSPLSSSRTATVTQTSDILANLKQPDVQGQLWGQTLTESLQQLASLWQLGKVHLGAGVCEQVSRYNLLCVKAQASLAEIATRGVPVIAELQDGHTLLIRGVVEENKQQHWLVADSQGPLQITGEALQSLLSGKVFFFISPPPFVNQTDMVEWQEWLQQRLTTLVPYSLQNASFAQQKTWLLESNAQVQSDDAWLLATLITATDYLGPHFANEQAAHYPSTRPWITTAGANNAQNKSDLKEGSSILEGVRYSEAPLTLSNLFVTPFYLQWPERSVVTQQAEQLNTAVATMKPDTTDSTGSEQEQETISPALQLLFDEAVRNTPYREPEPSWGFEREPLAPSDRQVASEHQTLPWLNELTLEQRALVPQLSYEQHLYRSSANERWVGLGGQRLREGERLGNLTVVLIQPHYTVFSLAEIYFKVEALEDL